jgi:hypothetical protein
MMEFYRYTWCEYAGHDSDGELCSPHFPSPSLELSKYDLVEETPKGYWIGFAKMKMKWIPKESKKRYAYPTKEEALNNFVKRTTKRIKILEWQLSCCKTSLNMAIENQKKPED